MKPQDGHGGRALGFVGGPGFAFLAGAMQELCLFLLPALAS
jgi:hypothetical protein